MTIVVLLLLAVAWAVILIPPAVRARAEGRPTDSIISFRRQLRVIQRTAPGTTALSDIGRSGPRAVVAGDNIHRLPVSYALAGSRARTLKRRRDVLTALLIGMSVTLVLGFVPGFRLAWALHVALDAMFAAYIALLIRTRNRAAEREMKLRFLPKSAASPQPALLLRRSAN